MDTSVPGAGSRPTRVALAIYDAQGRQVRQVIAEWREPGEYGLSWDGLTGSGAVASGMYFARLSAGGRERVRRVVTLR